MTVVFDSSAVLAMIFDEPGGAVAADKISEGVICSVNLSEIVAKLIDKGLASGAAVDTVEAINLPVISLDQKLAVAAGRLRCDTKGSGLSLGDRACLALGRQLSAKVLTADRAWVDAVENLDVELIR